MQNDVEEKISRFYNTEGWETIDDVTEDARRWEDLRECAREYVSKCRRRVMRHIPERGENMLDMASGPIQYKEHLEYSRNFRRRYCIDLSSKALDDARKKIGDHGVFLHGSFFDIHLEENFFDCTISLHTLFHIDKDRQEEAVRKFLKVTKPGKPIIIVYSNPHALFNRLPFQIIKKLKKQDDESQRIYLHAYPLSWWDRFKSVADVKILLWRTFGAGHQKRLMPDNTVGEKMFDVLYAVEEIFPRFIARFSFFPMIILTKKA